MTDEEIRKVLEKLGGGAAKVVNLNCPSCGSTDVVKCGDGHYHCQSCDTNFTLDNGPRVVINGNIVFQEGHETSSRDNYKPHSPDFYAGRFGTKINNHRTKIVTQIKVAHNENEAKRIALNAIYKNPALPEDLLEEMTITNIRLVYLYLTAYLSESGLIYMDTLGVCWRDVRSDQIKRLSDRRDLNLGYGVDGHAEMPCYDITYRYKEKDYHIFVYACKGATAIFGKEFPVNKKFENLKAKQTTAENSFNDWSGGLVVFIFFFVGLLILGLVMRIRNEIIGSIVSLSVSALLAVLIVLFSCFIVKADKDSKARAAEIKAYQKEREERCRKIYEEKVKELGGNL